MNFRLFPLSMVRGRSRGIKTRRRKYVAWYLFRVITECTSYDKGSSTFHLRFTRNTQHIPFCDHMHVYKYVYLLYASRN